MFQIILKMSQWSALRVDLIANSVTALQDLFQCIGADMNLMK